MLDGQNSRLWVLVLTTYFAAHTMIRVAIGMPLTPDEAQLLATATDMAWHYGNQLPLYFWLQNGMLELIADPLISLALLKNLIMLILALAVFGAVRAAAPVHWAWLATICMLFLPQLSWTSQHAMGAPVLATSLAALTVLAVVAVRKSPVMLRFFWLGLVAGLGLITTPSFQWFLVALLLAVLSQPHYRRVALSWRILPAAAVAGGIAAMPYTALFRIDRSLILIDLSRVSMSLDQVLERVRDGYAFLQTGIMFAAILLVGICVVIYKGLGPRHATKPETAALRDLIARVVCIGFLSLLTAAIVFGRNTNEFAEIQPIMFLTAPAAVLYLYPLMTSQAHRTFAVAAAAAAMVVLVLSPAYYAFGPHLPAEPIALLDR